MPPPRATNMSPEKARHDALLDEAAVELNTQGVSQTSLAAIAARLGVTRAALYYYAEDQEDLIFQCYRRSCEVIARRLSRARKEADGAVERIEAFVDAMLVQEEPEIAAISELAYLSGKKRETIEGLLEGIVAQLARLIEGGVKEGTIRPCGSAHIARAILAMSAWPSLLKRFDPRYAVAKEKAYPEIIKELIKQGVASNRSRLPDLDRNLCRSGPAMTANVFAADELASAKREALLGAGSQILNRKGVSATSLDEIALSLGVSKAVIYHNVGDKPTFVLECYRRSNRIFVDIAEKVQRSAGSRLDAAASGIRALCRLHFLPTSPLLLPIVGFASVSTRVADELRAQQLRLQTLWLRIFEDGRADKSIRPMNSELALAMTPALLHWVAQWHGEVGEAEIEEIATETANLWSVGILPLGGGKPGKTRA
ncbi:MAG: TetR/AcrR family transcriptional regulator [Hyphomonadaceae bacterium]